MIFSLLVVKMASKHHTGTHSYVSTISEFKNTVESYYMSVVFSATV